MPRVKRGVKGARKRSKILKHAKGYRGARGKLLRSAKEAVERGWAYAYRDRRRKKRDFRALWIQRINAAARLHGISYSRLISGLTKAGVEIDRKVLSQLAVSDPDGFAHLAQLASGKQQG